MKVIATNGVGNSIDSALSNSIYFERIPNAPIMTNDVEKTHATRIGVKWAFPDELGGHTFISYKLTWD